MFDYLRLVTNTHTTVKIVWHKHGNSKQIDVPVEVATDKIKQWC